MTPNTRSNLESRIAVFAAIVSVLAVGSWRLSWWPVINHDVAAIGLVANSMLDGTTLYKDIPQPNPPLVFWLTSLVLMVARWLAVPWTLALFYSIFLWIVGTTLLSERVLARHTIAPRLRFAIVGLVFFIHGVVVGPDFGQREALAIAAWTPHALATSCAMSGVRLSRRLGVLVGLVSGLGLALKPFFPPIWLFAELAAVAMTRSWRTVLRTENAAFSFVMVGYLFASVFGSSYFQHVQTWIGVYGAYNTDFYGLVASIRPTGLLMVVMVVGASRILVRHSNSPPMDLIFLAALPGAALAVIAQRKGFGYHAWPEEALMMLVVGMSLCRLDDRFTKPRPSWFVAAIALMGTGFAFSQTFNARDIDYPCSTGQQFETCSLQELVDTLGEAVEPGGKVMWVSTNVIPQSWVVSETGTKLVVDASLMLVPAAYPPEAGEGEEYDYHDPAQASVAEQRTRDTFIELLASGQVDAVVFDARAGSQGFGAAVFDSEAWLRHDPRTRDLLEVGFRRLDLRNATNGSHRAWVRVH